MQGLEHLQLKSLTKRKPDQSKRLRLEIRSTPLYIFFLLPICLSSCGTLVSENIDPEPCLQIEIVLGKTDKFDELMVANAGDANAGDGEEQT